MCVVGRLTTVHESREGGAHCFVGKVGSGYLLSLISPVLVYCLVGNLLLSSKKQNKKQSKKHIYVVFGLCRSRRTTCMDSVCKQVRASTRSPARQCKHVLSMAYGLECMLWTYILQYGIVVVRIQSSYYTTQYESMLAWESIRNPGMPIRIPCNQTKFESWECYSMMMTNKSQLLKYTKI